MTTRKFNAAVVVRTYEDKEGNQKKVYHEIGAVLENEEGHLDLNLEVLPLPNPQGQVWIKLFPVKEKEE
ncbi:hypothetical protein [Altibacter sp. HG106]|uniref:hypothetical protein n=1 Tax=Altibacter sp. HG106 TaxID=3023937 RepID=UPI002350B835|nr:hypothetical protein [Altibacter sp. HG106]MDC7994453.1 hypothetical protein [Altibacter sp. HG106]